MAINQKYKISSEDIKNTGLQSVVGDTLEGSTEENKKSFDALPTLIANRFNSALDYLYDLVTSNQSATNENIASTKTEIQTDTQTKIDNVTRVVESNKSECDTTKSRLTSLETFVNSNKVTKAQIYYGTSEPASSLGVDGDIYIQIVGD